MADFSRFNREQVKGKRGRPRVFDDEESRSEFAKLFCHGRVTSRRAALNYLHLQVGLQALVSTAHEDDSAEDIFQEFAYLLSERNGKGRMTILSELGRLRETPETIRAIAHLICQMRIETNEAVGMLRAHRYGDSSWMLLWNKAWKEMIARRSD